MTCVIRESGSSKRDYGFSRFDEVRKVWKTKTKICDGVYWGRD